MDQKKISVALSPEILKQLEDGNYNVKKPPKWPFNVSE